MQTGRSMVELLGVIAIISMLTVGALTGFPQMRRSMNVSKTQNEIALIAQDLNNMTYWFRTYPTGFVDMDVLCENDIFPRKCEGGVAKNPFNGQYVVDTDKETITTGPDGNPITEALIIEITATGLPNLEVCEEIEKGVKEYGPLKDAETKCTSSGTTATIKVKFQ